MDDISKKLDFFEQNGRLPGENELGVKVEGTPQPAAAPLTGGQSGSFEVEPVVKEEKPVDLTVESDRALDGLTRLWMHRALNTKAEVDKEKDTVAKTVGVPIGWLDNERVYAEAKSAAARKQRLERLFPNGVGEDALATLYKEYPWLQKVKGLNEEEGPKVILDAVNLHKAYGVIEAARAGWEGDEIHKERGGFGFEKMLAGGLNDADKEKLRELDNKVKDVKQIPGLFDAPVENVVGGMVSSYKAMARQAVYGGTAAAAAAGSFAGITAGGIAGMAVSGVDGITTSGIAVAARIAAGRASLTAASKAVPYGMAAKMFQEEAGNYYLDFLGYKNKDGGQLMSNDEAALYAVAAGAAQALVEYADFGMVMKVLRRNVKGKALKEAEKVLAGAKTGTTALARIQQLFKDKGWDFLKVTGAESAEESVQSVSDDFIKRIIAVKHPERAVEPDEKKGIDDSGIVPKYSWPEIFSRAWQNFIESLGVTAGFGVFAVGGSLHSGVRRVARMYEAEQVLDQETVKTVQGAEMLEKLGEFYQTNELAKESPELVDKVVKAQLEGTGFEDVFVDTELVKKEEGGEKAVEILEQAAISSGMTEEEVKASRETGAGLVLSASTFAKLDPEVAKKLDRFISFSEGTDCLAVIQNRAKELQEKVHRAALKEAEDMRAGVQKAAKKVTGDAEEQTELVQVLEKYGENFKEGFEKEYENAVKERDEFVDGFVDEMAKGMKPGVAFITREDWTHTYTSNNDRWYSEYVRANKKAPTKAEMRQLVLDAMEGNNPYGIGTYEDELVEAAEVYKDLSHRVEVLGSLRGKLDGVDVADLAAARELSKEGKEVYDKCLALLGKNGKRFKDRGVTAAARANAMMVALYCDRMAEKWNALAGGEGSIKPHTKEQLAVTAARSYQELHGGAKVYTALDYFRTLHTVFNQDLGTVLGGREAGVWNEEVRRDLAAYDKIIGLKPLEIETAGKKFVTAYKEAESILLRVFNKLGEIKNNSDDTVARFNKNTAGKVAWHLGFNVANIADYLGNLYENAVLFSTEPEIKKDGHKAHPNIDCYKHYLNSFSFDGVDYYIRFTVTVPVVRNKKKGTGDNIIHNTNISEISVYKKEKSNAASLPVITRANKSNELSYGQSIADSSEAVKPYVDKKVQEFFNKVEKEKAEILEQSAWHGTPHSIYNQGNGTVQGQSGVAEPRRNPSAGGAGTSPNWEANRGLIREAEKDRFVALLEHADASTFFHEFGHICYLDLEAMASNVMATEQMKKDFATVDGWTTWTPEQLKEYEHTSGYGQMAAIDKEIREAMGTPQPAAAPLTGGQEGNGKRNNKRLEAALKRWKQERWARAVEEYVREGRVPSNALRRVLADVLKWLKKVYRGLKGAGVPMSKEVKDVMDRMLVSEEMVDAADVRAEAAAFEKAGGLELGSGSAREMWTKLYDEVHEAAEARVRKLVMGDLAEERQRKMEEARAEEREKATELFRKKPHFVVQEFLRLNPKLDLGMLCSKAGITVEEYENGLKLDGGSVEAAVDKYMRDVYEPFLQREFYVSEEEMRAEAEKALGESRYRSVLTAFESEMLDKWQRRFERLYRAEVKKQAEHRKERQAAEKAVEKMDEEKTALERQKLREDAQRETIKQLKEELKKQKQATRQAALEVVRNCRKYAAVKMDEMSLSQSANPVMWERLARQAQDRVTKFLNGQKYAEAANAKKEQLVYETMAAEAAERQKKLIRNNAILQNKVKNMKKEKNVEYNHRYLMERVMYLYRLVPSMSTKFHDDYIGPAEVLNRMLENLTLAGADEAQTKANLPKWLEFVIFSDNPLATDNRVAGGFMSLTWAKYNELSDFLKNMYTAGRNAKRICSFKDDKGQEISIADATQKIKDESLVRNEIKAGGSKGLMDNPTTREKLAKRGNELFVMTIKPEELVDRLGETARKLIYEPLKHCFDREDRMMAEMKTRINSMFDSYAAKKLEIMGDKAGRKFLRGIYSEKRYKVERNNVTHEQLLCLALNWGNVKNRQRVCDGYGVEEADVFYALKNLDSADWELVKGFWKLFADNYDDYNKCIMNTTGVAMGKVEATPFTVLGNDGVLHGLEGGYYPIVYDRTKSERAEERSLDEAVRSQLGGAQRIGMGIGSSKSRAKGRVMEPVLLSLDGGMQKAEEVVHAICFRETCCDLFKLVNQNQDFQTLCTGALGKECTQVLNNWVLDSWHTDIRQLNAMDRLMAGVRHNVTSAVLGFRTMTALVNFANVAVAMNYVGPVNYLRSVVNFYRRPSEQWQFVKDKSVFMRDRAESLDRDVREVLKQSPKVSAAGNKIRKGYDWVNEHAFRVIAFTDFMGSAPAWVCAYEAEFRKCVDAGLDAKVCEQRAVDAGDEVVRRSYGSGRDVDLAEVQKGGRNRSEAVKMLTMYYSFMSTLHNGMYHAVQEARQQGNKGKDKWMPVVKYGFYAYFLNCLIENLIRSGGDDDDDKVGFLGKVGLMSADLMAGGFPVVRDIVGSVTRILAGERVMGSRGHAVVQFGDDVVQLLQQLSKGADTAKVLRTIGTVTSTVTGISKTLLNLPSVTAEFVGNGDFSLQDWEDFAEAAAMDKTIKRVRKEDGRK